MRNSTTGTILALTIREVHDSISTGITVASFGASTSIKQSSDYRHGIILRLRSELIDARFKGNRREDRRRQPRNLERCGRPCMTGYYPMASCPDDSIDPSKRPAD